MAARSIAHSAVAPWAGLALGALGWILQHQLGTYVTLWDCSRSGPWFTTTLGILGALMAGGGGWISWRARTAALPAPIDAPGAGSHRFLGTLSAGFAALMLLAIVQQTLAGLILWECQR